MISAHFFFFMSVFSLRRSSGSTTGITTLSCPSCSTGWVSRCPAGSEKSWSTPGSSMSGGSSQPHALNHSSTLQGEHWPSGPKCLKIPNILERDSSMRRVMGRIRNLNLNHNLLMRTGNEWIRGGEGSRVAFSNWWVLRLLQSFKSCVSAAGHNQDSGNPLDSVLKKGSKTDNGVTFCIRSPPACPPCSPCSP